MLLPTQIHNFVQVEKEDMGDILPPNLVMMHNAILHDLQEITFDESELLEVMTPYNMDFCCGILTNDPDDIIALAGTFILGTQVSLCETTVEAMMLQNLYNQQNIFSVLIWDEEYEMPGILQYYISQCIEPLKKGDDLPDGLMFRVHEFMELLKAHREIQKAITA